MYLGGFGWDALTLTLIDWEWINKMTMVCKEEIRNINICTYSKSRDGIILTLIATGIAVMVAILAVSLNPKPKSLTF